MANAEDDCDDLYEFLTSRIGEERTLQIKEENIDAATLLLMNDEQLTRYIPRQGDRLATIQFCRRITDHIRNPVIGKRDQKRRNNLLEKLRKKFRQNDDDNKPQHHYTSRRGRQKASRMIEVGWLYFDTEVGAYKQIRAKKGGGTRHLSVLKSARKSDILKLATDMYFPQGISPRGKLSDFTVALKDFKESDIDEELTLGDMYERTNMRTMRFYLATRKKEALTLSDSECDDHMMGCTMSTGEPISSLQVTLTSSTPTAAFGAPIAALPATSSSTSTSTAALGAPVAVLPATPTPTSPQTAALGVLTAVLPATSTYTNPPTAALGAYVAALPATSISTSPPTAALGAPVATLPATSTSTCTPTAALGASVAALQATSTSTSTPTAALGAPVAAPPATSTSTRTPTAALGAPVATLPAMSTSTSTLTAALDAPVDALPATFTSTRTQTAALDGPVLDFVLASSPCTQTTVILSPIAGQSDQQSAQSGQLVDRPTILPIHTETFFNISDEVDIGIDESGTIHFGPAGDEADINLDVTRPLQVNYEEESREVIIRRSFCLKDVVAAFSDPTLVSKRLSFRWKRDNGGLENAVGDGVYRDVITQFWEEMYSQCTEGLYCKVPHLRHDFQEDHWKSVARVYLVGWREFKYIPHLLAAPFMEYAIYGKSFTSLTESFLNYLNTDEREVVAKALTEFDVDQIDDLIDVLDQYKCRKLPTNENIHRIIEEIASTQLIQTPMFVINCWNQELSPMAFQSHDTFISLYESLTPTTKTVKKSLIIPERLQTEHSMKYLQKFVGGLDERLLTRFLRYCTGADLYLGYTINVNPIDVGTGANRRPIGHTCTHELDLPTEYDSFPEFRDEFTNILNSNEWDMECS